MRWASLGRLGIWKYQHRRAKFNPETAGDDLLRVMARAGDSRIFLPSKPACAKRKVC
jgi:hypothetical protein